MNIIKEFQYDNETVVIIKKSELTESNSGYYNPGDNNLGYHNSGDNNSGDNNRGYWNSGDHNSGNHNSGDDNSGDFNSGYYNPGDNNSGNHNSGDFNSGMFNTDIPNIRMFNKDTNFKRAEIIDEMLPNFLHFSLTEWIEEKNMSIEEKAQHPDAHIHGGYLKIYGYKEAFQKSWNNTSKEDQLKILDLPNFDADIFKEISGIDVIRDMINENN